MPPVNSQAIWYVTAGGREQGPFTPPQLKALVAQGKVGVATLIRKEGMAKSVPAGTVQGLLTAAPTAAQPALTRALDPSAEARHKPAQVIEDGADASDVDSDAEPGGDEPAQGRTGVGLRIASGVIDWGIYAALAIVLSVLIGVMTARPVIQLNASLVQSWAEEMDRFRDHTHAANFLRILGQEDFPRFDASRDNIAEVLVEVEGLRLRMAAVEEVATPEQVLDQVIYAWRERLALPEGQTAVTPEIAAAARSTPISGEDRIAVVQWRQYDDFQSHVQRSEAALRSNLRNQAGYLRDIERRHERELEDLGASLLLRMVIVVVVAIPVFLLLVPLCEVFLGASIGKRLLGQRVITLGGRRVGLGAALLRQILRIIPLYFVTVFLAERQGLHDMLSRTQSVPQDAVPEVPRGTVSRARRGAAPRRGRGRRQGASQ